METIVESHADVDWLTCTRRLSEQSLSSNSEMLFMRLASLASMAAPEDLALAKITERSLLGFAGLGMAGLFVGRSDTHEMVQASGWLAGAVWRELNAMVWRATRLDIQETLWFTRDLGRMWASDLADSARLHKGKRTGRGPMPMVDLYDSDAGCTLYVGGKLAEQRGRCYDKFRESLDGRYRNAYRMEVQLRDTAAEQMYGVLHSVGYSDANHMRRFVHSWFNDRWVALRSSDMPPLRIQPVRDDSEWIAASKLAWLERSVKPTVLRLLPFVEKETIMASLGLAGSEEADTEREVG